MHPCPRQDAVLNFAGDFLPTRMEVSVLMVSNNYNLSKYGRRAKSLIECLVVDQIKRCFYIVKGAVEFVMQFGEKSQSKNGIDGGVLVCIINSILFSNVNRLFVCCFHVHNRFN